MSFEPTDEIVAVMKNEATKLQFMAEAALAAYDDALKRLLSNKLRNAVNAYVSKEKPVICRIPFSDGAAEVAVVGVKVDWRHDGKALFFTKTKAGKWSKSLSECDAEWAIRSLVICQPQVVGR